MSTQIPVGWKALHVRNKPWVYSVDNGVFCMVYEQNVRRVGSWCVTSFQGYLRSVVGVHHRHQTRPKPTQDGGVPWSGGYGTHYSPPSYLTTTTFLLLFVCPRYTVRVKVDEIPVWRTQEVVGVFHRVILTVGRYVHSFEFEPRHFIERVSGPTGRPESSGPRKNRNRGFQSVGLFRESGTVRSY